MAVSVELPDLGRDMAGGLVAEWYLPDGAAVGAGEPVCRVECAFVAYEVEAAESGLLRIRRPAGSIERVGEVLGVILEPGEALPHEEPSSRHGPVAEAPLVSEVPEPEPEAALLEPGVPELEPELELELEPETPEAVVVPFPRRFAAVAAVEWEMAPGDAVEFHTSFFSGAVDEVTHALPEAGGSIPGLPLWEPEEGHQASPAAPDGARERFQRISDEASASAQVLTMSIDIDLSEAAKLVSVCQREWQKHGVVPRVEDAAFRAICLAIETTDLAGGAGGIVIAESSTDVSCAVGNVANKTLREAATSRAAGGDTPFEQSTWVLVSLFGLGIAAAAPRLDGGRTAAFALASPGRDGCAALTMAYDSSRWSEGSAGRLLGRIRELLESPCAMLI